MKKKTIRQSKRLIISLFVTFFCLTASAAQAQTALVTIDLQQVKMVQVMDEIENQTKYLFIYDKNERDILSKIAVAPFAGAWIEMVLCTFAE